MSIKVIFIFCLHISPTLWQCGTQSFRCPDKYRVLRAGNERGRFRFSERQVSRRSRIRVEIVNNFVTSWRLRSSEGSRKIWFANSCRRVARLSDCMCVTKSTGLGFASLDSRRRGISAVSIDVGLWPRRIPQCTELDWDIAAHGMRLTSRGLQSGSILRWTNIPAGENPPQMTTDERRTSNNHLDNCAGTQGFVLTQLVWV